MSMFTPHKINSQRAEMPFFCSKGCNPAAGVKDALRRNPRS